MLVAKLYFRSVEKERKNSSPFSGASGSKKRAKFLNGLRSIKKTLRVSNRTARIIDMSPHEKQKKASFITYVQNLLDKIKNKLESLESAAFVLCIEKSIMNTLHMNSRLDFLEFIRESGIVGFKDNLRKFTVVYQGEKKIWNILQKVN
jgi:hypothetical protein